jgi:hypothetical protein
MGLKLHQLVFATAEKGLHPMTDTSLGKPLSALANTSKRKLNIKELHIVLYRTNVQYVKWAAREN